MKKYTLFIIALLLFAGTWALAFCQSPKNEAQVVTVRTVVPGMVASISDKATLQSRNKVDARIHGMRHVWNLELNFEMEKCNGEWIILEAIAHSY